METPEDSFNRRLSALSNCKLPLRGGVGPFELFKTDYTKTRGNGIIIIIIIIIITIIIVIIIVIIITMSSPQPQQLPTPPSSSSSRSSNSRPFLLPLHRVPAGCLVTRSSLPLSFASPLTARTPHSSVRLHRLE
ncbi:hypothetical protein E2C01_058695 [Portunus trituberculatus]|uniref:Uncharacterized protein n=1 Tax=Portunus trituberculatus TaxID=210409 RepID=A0A5B7H5F9_PORTR|nr:hypothetical protein [Portunus trituberculatus]